MEISRIITIEGITVHAKEFEIYSIVACSDGFDYIIEIINGNKEWILYNANDIKEYKNNKEFIKENDLPKMEQPEINIVAPIKNVKSKINIIVPIIEKKKEIEIIEEPIIKKKGRPIKIKIEVKEEKVNKKIIKFKEIQVPDEKKLSEYHTFIRNFLSQNSDIVWNERMKAANAAWKVVKEVTLKN